MVILLCVALFLIVSIALVSPWRRNESGAQSRDEQRLNAAATEVLDLEAARDAKYREIRDAELDRETGHLSAEDFRAIDTTLRAEAVELLKRLDQAEDRLVRLRSIVAEAKAGDASDGPAARGRAAEQDAGESELTADPDGDLSSDAPALRRE